MKGKLISMYGGKTFGDVDTEKLGLKELPCEERAGLVWVCLTPWRQTHPYQTSAFFAGQLFKAKLFSIYVTKGFTTVHTDQLSFHIINPSVIRTCKLSLLTSPIGANWRTMVRQFAPMGEVSKDNLHVLITLGFMI